MSYDLIFVIHASYIYFMLLIYASYSVPSVVSFSGSASSNLSLLSSGM